MFQTTPSINNPCTSATIESNNIGLYNHNDARDSCGFGMVTNLDGQPKHRYIEMAIQALVRLDHRGGVNIDGTSDGCGLTIQKPDRFLRKVAKLELNIDLPERYAVASVFLHPNEDKAQQAQLILEQALVNENINPLGWRNVPMEESACADLARLSMPRAAQLFVDVSDINSAELTAKLFIVRRKTELALAEDTVFYICTLSEKILCYKGLARPEALPKLYPDLNDPLMETALCLFHVRYSTNTLPHWSLAHPFRLLAHNGEINTIVGNRNWSIARTNKYSSALLPDISSLAPLVNMEGSDSSSLDNMLDFLIAGGMDPVCALRVLIPPAYEQHPLMDKKIMSFYQYYRMHIEPWDGPTGIVMTDGHRAMCILDRNGLRPARYYLCNDDTLVVSSEAGVLDYAPDQIKTKGRVGPGNMLVVDTKLGILQITPEIEQTLSEEHDYAGWFKKYTVSIPYKKHHEKIGVSALADDAISRDALLVYRKFFQCSPDEYQQILTPLARGGAEATGSMGDDTPIAVLSDKIRPLYDMLRQKFAQVTNPAIDSLRESVVMSFETHLGREHNIFDLKPENAANVALSSPILSSADFKAVLSLTSPFKASVIDCTYDPKNSSLEPAIVSATQEVAEQVRNGVTIVILSDMCDLTAGRLPIPSILLTGAIHRDLIQQGLRSDANIVVATASARDSHQIACLFGYGATAVYPWLAYEMCAQLATIDSPKLNISFADTQRNYRSGIEKGLLKIMSKMGISTLASYRGSGLFDLLGFDQAVIDLCFADTPSRINGLGFTDIEEGLKQLQTLAIDAFVPLAAEGVMKYMHQGERHAFEPNIVHAIHGAVRSGEATDYQAYKEAVDGRETLALRDLLSVKHNDASAISVDEVEDGSLILKRFDSAGMSLGALSPESHETLAMAMNRLGGRSNSGEGGEDPLRYEDDRCSKIKQIASGRFGVTPHYLVNAEVIQIKIAQGAKPGEGGQLPGSKVNGLIARLRCAAPGVSLISPPPHHDIYCIEDLSQLIYDLKEVNDSALVSVKLVSEPGIGTIAAGVTKAGADLITVSGHDGGTGASPMSSIRYAGSPWELGLSEVHQSLCINGLRNQVRVQVDGGLKTGLDIIKGAILGAESFGFGTAPMIAMGCKYLRICHLNNCATGIATQQEVLRSNHFKGDVQAVMNFFNFIVEDVRQHLALLGVKRLEDIIGQFELLEALPNRQGKKSKIDFSRILSHESTKDTAVHFCNVGRKTAKGVRILSNQLLNDLSPLIESKTSAERDYVINNVDRAIGAAISGMASRHNGSRGLIDSPLQLNFVGTAGQSFGAWNVSGLNLKLIGDANDYVGKGMAGGRIVIRPCSTATFKSNEAIIAGNTCLYGGTGGELFAAGIVGERFAVRNSGVRAVVEGAGDHCCEYMTGGAVAVLGRCGINFGAGMTGGMAFVLDRDNDFKLRCNADMVEILPLASRSYSAFADLFKGLLEDFVLYTTSDHGHYLLEHWRRELKNFYLVVPRLDRQGLAALLKREQARCERNTNTVDMLAIAG